VAWLDEQLVRLHVLLIRLATLLDWLNVAAAVVVVVVVSREEVM
jgi:hypothetical protein